MKSPTTEPSSTPPGIVFKEIPRSLRQMYHLPSKIPFFGNDLPRPDEIGHDLIRYSLDAIKTLLAGQNLIPFSWQLKLFLKKWPVWEEALPFIEQGSNSRAIDLLLPLLELDPDCVLTRFYLGLCHRAQGRLERGEAFLQQSLFMAPSVSALYANMGRTYYLMEDFERAVQFYKISLRMSPGDSLAMSQLEALGALEDSYRDIEGLKRDLVAEEKGRREKAEEEVKQAKGYEEWTALGFSLLTGPHTDLALICYESALGEKPNEVMTRMGLGIACRKMGRITDSVQWLKKCLELDPASSTSHFNLFLNCLDLNDHEAALDEIEMAVESSPDWNAGNEWLFAYFVDRGKTEEGLKWLLELSSRHPQVVAPLLVIARHYETAKKWNEAFKILSEILSRSPGHEDALLMFCDCFEDLGDDRTLVEKLMAIKDEIPYSVTARLALALSRLGEKRRAVEILNSFQNRPGSSAAQIKQVDLLIPRVL